MSTHEDDPQIHLSGKVPGAGTLVVKLIGPLSTAVAAVTCIAPASGAIAAAIAGSTTDTTGKERNVLRFSDFRSTGDFRFTGTLSLSYCRLIQYGTGTSGRLGAS